MTLSSLKLVTAKKQLSASPIVHRRNKLVAKLHEQIELCEAKRSGQQCTNQPRPARPGTYQEGADEYGDQLGAYKDW